ncbi:hypothetical protein IA69_18980 [Massilia sp. JS1662]|nr:hypothetical protein IA69_18980 [Massilia sp. JS1662]
MGMQELSIAEIDEVSGGNTKPGAAMTLGAAGLGIAGSILAFTPFAAIGGVLLIGGAGIGALAYAYDMASDAVSSGAAGGGGSVAIKPPPTRAR